MKKLMLLLSLVLAFSSYARELTTEQKLNDLNELVSMIKGGYGPLEYKKQEFGIDIDILTEKYSKLIAETTSNSEFYYLIVQFVAEFNDSHFGARLPTDHVGKLGFRTDYVDDKVLIESIDREMLSKKDFPFEKGDEIISVDGQPVLKLMEEIYPYMGQGTKLTALRKAGTLVSLRPGSLLPVQEGKVKLVIKKGSSEFTEEVELEWKLSGTPLDEFVPTKNTVKSLNAGIGVNYDKISLIKDASFENSFRCSGTTRIKIPEGATMIMEKPFVAYYHKTEKGNIGYLRIPHYSPRESNPQVNAYELRFKQYEFAVRELEKHTVGLIIDQDHNCGGSVTYLHNILSLFAQVPFAPTQFELLATKQSYLDFKRWMNTIYEFTIDFQERQKVIDLVKETWLNENTLLTTKIGLSGKDFHQPNHITYTKPIIVLIDENSGSGGDAFPAMMQGIGRAKLLGTQTMGAGGHVIELPLLTNSQIKVRMTKSLFYHPNAVAIENNGAYPDIKYRPTRDDFVYEYRGYQKFYLNELFKLIKN